MGTGEARREAGGRLSSEKLRSLEGRAVRFRQLVTRLATRKVQARQFDSLYAATFAISAELIERRADWISEKAEDTFDEIEAFGQEPELDDDWLDELTGEKDKFYFSTQSLVRELERLPRKKRARKRKGDLDEQQMAAVVEEAVQSMEEALSVSHVEQPQIWIEKIKGALHKCGGTATFCQLKKSTGLSKGALFLGLLLGQENWDIGQKTFYEQVSVTLRDRG
ncbi:MAG: hypothetical protein AAF171_17795 [Cyanobacteria bacterium P01_A01_bin.116]